MEIKVGGFYRMRCGGAVRIEDIFEGLALHEEQGITWRVKDGYYCSPESPSIFDLVAEITEAEYNLIVSGEYLKEQLYNVVEVGQLRQEIAVLRNHRRFEAAKAAMQGILANPEFGASWAKGTVIEESKWYADALLKALEEIK